MEMELQFLDPNLTYVNNVTGTYNWSWIFLSVFIAIVAAYSAIKISEQIKETYFKKMHWLWMALGAAVLSCGIWSMHFIGMMALSFDFPVSYDLNMTLISIIPAFVGSFVGVYGLSRQRLNFIFLNIVGLIVGLGIGCMHYVGMMAMHMNAEMYFRKDLFYASVFVAYLLATGSFYLIFNSDKILVRASSELRRIISAIFLGMAISGMHYVGMKAAYYFPLSNDLMDIPGINSTFIMTLIVFVNAIGFGLTVIFGLIFNNVKNLYLYKNEIEKNEKELLARKKHLDIAALVSETDLKGIITYVNDHFCKVSQYTPDELINHSHSVVNSGFHSQEFWKTLWDTIQKGQVWRGEICNRAKDGSLYWVDATILPIKDIQGITRGYSAIRVDITQRKESEVQLIHASKLASIGELAAGVGHEINNPLMIAKGNVEKLKKSVNSSEWMHLFENIESSIDRIAVIVDGLRSYARLDKNNFQKIDVHGVIHQTVSLVSSVYSTEGIQLSESLHAENFFISGNLGEFQQVLMNLISNAKDAIGNQSNKQIVISTKNINGEILISVQDNGMGIPENIKGKIFDTYFTTKEVGKGTGMGLSISYKITKEMKGRITVDSTLGKGSVFNVFLPSVVGSKTSQEAITFALPDQNKTLIGKALILDDEPGIREILNDYLTEMGLVVKEAASGPEALELMKNEKFDYVFTDLKMPIMTGDQFIKEAQKNSASSSTKYFVMTGGITMDFSLAGQDNPNLLIDGYIQKPFSKEVIYSVLKKS